MGPAQQSEARTDTRDMITTLSLHKRSSTAFIQAVMHIRKMKLNVVSRVCSPRKFNCPILELDNVVTGKKP